jgi:hypothetical protein
LKLEKAIRTYLEVFERAGFSRRYVRETRFLLQRFAAFCRTRGAKKIHDVTAVTVADYQKWVSGLRRADGRPLSGPYQARHVQVLWRLARFLAGRLLVLPDFGADRARLRGAPAKSGTVGQKWNTPRKVKFSPVNRA